MVRLVLSLMVGAAGCAAVVALDARHLGISAPLVGLAAGVALGIILGWRAPRPARAFEGGLTAGTLAGALMAAAQVYALPQSLAALHLPDWLLGQMDEVTLAWALTGATAGLCFLAAMGVGSALAGIVSAWTGMRAPSAARAPVVASTLGIAPAGIAPQSTAPAGIAPQSTAPASPARAADTGGLLPGPMD